MSIVLEGHLSRPSASDQSWSGEWMFAKEKRLKQLPFSYNVFDKLIKILVLSLFSLVAFVFSG
jgi:hypothetical protein